MINLDHPEYTTNTTDIIKVFKNYVDNKNITKSHKLMTVQHYSELLHLIGLNDIKTSVVGLKIGDKYFGRNNIIYVLFDDIRPSDTINDIIYKRSLPLTTLMFPKNMKKALPVVSMWIPWMGSMSGKYKNMINNVPDNKQHIMTPGRQIDEYFRIYVREGTIVEYINKNTHLELLLHHYMTRNFLHLEYWIMNPVLIDDIERENGKIVNRDKYITKVHVVIQNVWEPEPHYEIVAIYGGPFHEGINPMMSDIVELTSDPVDYAIDVKFKLKNQAYIANFDRTNSIVKLVNAYETW